MEWQPIETAPCGEALLVASSYEWSLARKVSLATSTLQARWPFIKAGREWAWVFSCSEGRKIGFAPTHWKRPDIFPAPPVEQAKTEVDHAVD